MRQDVVCIATVWKSAEKVFGNVPNVVLHCTVQHCVRLGNVRFTKLVDALPDVLHDVTWGRGLIILCESARRYPLVVVTGCCMIVPPCIRPSATLFTNEQEHFAQRLMTDKANRYEDWGDGGSLGALIWIHLDSSGLI
jgi:hypothetical protein